MKGTKNRTTIKRGASIRSRAIVDLEGDEDTLIDSVIWLMRKEYAKYGKAWDDYIQITVEDGGSWTRSLFGHSFHEVDRISGEIEFSYELEKKIKKIGLPTPKERAMGFTADYAYIGKNEDDGVIVTLNRPVNKAYHIRGLSSEEFEIVKVEDREKMDERK